MKKISLSLLAFAALSSAAFAGPNRGYDLRESPTCFGKYCENAVNKPAERLTRAFAVKKSVKKLDSGLTSFERTMKISIENDHGRH